MIKSLFTKRDHRPVPGLTKEQAMQAASWFWRSRNFGVNFTSPYSLHGEQFYSKLGLRQSIDVWAADEGQNVGVDLSFSAELTDVGAVAGIAGLVILWPVALVGGAVSYVEYENDAQRKMAEFWSYVNAFPKNPQPPSGPAPLPPWAQGQAPVQPVAQPVAPPPPPAPMKECPKCAGKNDPDGVFCKHCGAKL